MRGWLEEQRGIMVEGGRREKEWMWSKFNICLCEDVLIKPIDIMDT